MKKNSHLEILSVAVNDLHLHLLLGISTLGQSDSDLPAYHLLNATKGSKSYSGF